MPFSPWKEHQDVQNGACLNCGMSIPNEALFIKDGTACTYRHRYVNGEPVFSKNPAGRSEPCHSEK
jgi:hypothetical protein